MEIITDRAKRCIIKDAYCSVNDQKAGSNLINEGRHIGMVEHFSGIEKSCH